MILNEEIKKLVLEELGVSDVVKKFVDEVYNDFAEHGFSEGCDNFTIEKEFFDKKVSFGFFAKPCEKKYDFLRLNNSIEAHSMYRQTLPFVFVNIMVPLFGGKFDKPSIVDTIYHEINHIFQQISMQNEYGSKALYNISAKYINSEDKMLKVIAWSLYITSVGELDSFTNGLYGFIKTKIDNGIIPIRLFESDFFKKMAILKKCIEKINICGNKTKFIKALKHVNEEYKEITSEKLNLTSEKLLKRNEFILNKMKRNVGRVIANIQKEIMSGSCRGNVFDNAWITRIFLFERN